MAPRATAATKRKRDLPARRAARISGVEDAAGAAIMEAMLTAAGEIGFRDVAVQQVLERSGGHRVQFWERFESKEECFELAHAAWTDRLVAEILTAALAEDEWRRQLRGGIVAFLRFVEDRPALSRALLIEAEVAGGAAAAKRDETIERLGEALDSIREQLPVGERPPPLTGIFIAGGIAAQVSERLAARAGGEEIWVGLPELLRFAVGPYLGEAAAAEEVAAAEEILACR